MARRSSSPSPPCSGRRCAPLRTSASRLMPLTTTEITAAPRCRPTGPRARSSGSLALGAEPRPDIALAARQRYRGWPNFAWSIDVEHGYVGDAPTAIRIDAAYSRSRRLLRSRSRPTRRGLRSSWPTASIWRSPPASRMRRGGASASSSTAATSDLVQPDVTRAGGITETLRIAGAGPRPRRGDRRPMPGRAASSRPPPCT